MSSPLHRHILGFPVPFLYAAISNLTQGQSVTVTLPAGPGELLGFAVWGYNCDSVVFNDLFCKIVCDGVTLYDNYLYDLTMIPNGYNACGLFSASNQPASLKNGVSFKCKMSYESTFTIRFLNNNANISYILPSIYARVGV